MIILRNVAIVVCCICWLSNAQQQQSPPPSSPLVVSAQNTNMITTTAAVNGSMTNIDNLITSNEDASKVSFMNEKLDAVRESEINITTTTSSSTVAAAVTTSDEYRMLLGETSSIEDLLNDSAEVMDSPLNSDAEDGLGGGLSILQNSAFGSSRFDEFVLPDDLPQNTGTIKPRVEDFSNKNIYKVPKSKTKKAPTMNVKAMSSKSDTKKHYVNDFNSEKLTNNFENNKTHLGTYNNYFQAFTSLYEHNLWQAETLTHLISKECLSDLTFYLQSLKESKEWALKTTDSSGRYQGQYFFGNDYWLGSKTFCKEVNYMNGHTNPEIPQMYFFVAKILVKLEPVFHKVSVWK